MFLVHTLGWLVMVVVVAAMAAKKKEASGGVTTLSGVCGCGCGVGGVWCKYGVLRWALDFWCCKQASKQASKGGGALDTPYTPFLYMVGFRQPHFGNRRLSKARQTKRVPPIGLYSIYSYIMYH